MADKTVLNLQQENQNKSVPLFHSCHMNIREQSRLQDEAFFFRPFSSFVCLYNLPRSRFYSWLCFAMLFALAVEGAEVWNIWCDEAKCAKVPPATTEGGVSLFCGARIESSFLALKFFKTIF